MIKNKVFSLVYLYFIPLLLFPNYVSAGSETASEDSAKAYQLLNHAYNLTDTDSLLSLYQEIAVLFKKAEMSLHWTEIQLFISDVYAGNKEDNEQAARFLRTTLAETPWLKEPALLAKLRLNLAYYESASGQILAARSDYEEVRRYYESQKDTLQLFYIYDPLGNIYSRLGEYEKARRLLKMSLALRLKQKAYRLAAETSVNLGTSYFLTGNYQQAQSIYKKGLSYPELPALSKGPLLAKMAEIHLKQQNYTAAIKASLSVNQLLSGVEKSSKDYYLTPVLIHNYQLLAKAHVEQDNSQKGLNYANQALEIALTYYQTDQHREVAKIYRQLGDIYLEQQDLDEAAEFYQKALQSVIPNFHPKNNDTYPQQDDYYPENTIMTVLARKGKLYWQKYQQTRDTSFWEKSLQGYQKSLEIADTLRSIYRYESSSLQLQAEITEIIEQTLEITHHIFSQKKDSRYAIIALKLAEKNKAIVLQESIQKAEAQQNTEIPTYFLKHFSELRQNLAEKKRRKFRIEQSGNSITDSVIVAMNQGIFQLKESIDSLSIVLEDSFPAYQQLSHNSLETDVLKLQKNLQKSSSTMVEYFVGKAHVFALKLTGEEIHFQKLNISSPELKGQLEQFLPLLYNGRNFVDESKAIETRRVYTQLAHKLYQALLAPVITHSSEDGQKRLIIIPDGLLAKLNFDVLLTQMPAGNASFYTYPYLLRDYIIRYQSAASFLFKPAKPNASKSFIGYAPTYEENWLAENKVPELASTRTGFQPLDYTSQEVEAIQKLMGGNTYLGSQATEAHFMTHAADYQILHLAMHAFDNEEQPLYSGLVFSQFNDRDSNISAKTDNFLMAYEIYNQRLNADLAVLSACKTGSGKIAHGEGVMNLARAFRFAGCDNILMSLWEADDYATRFIMESFYSHLQKGKPKDEALNLAKIDFLNNAEADKIAPAFWATFVLIGNDQPTRLSKPIWNQGIYMGLIIITLILIFAVYRRKNLS